MDEDKHRVELFQYDISQGMAKMYGPMFIQRPLEGIWHTGIVVYGKEYFFGGGICNMPPGQTPFGNPYKKSLLGETQIPEEMFTDYLNTIHNRFTQATYNVISFNCNHFTNEISNFLLGENIPYDIYNQAQDLINTPIGQTIKPMLESMQSTLQQGTPMFNDGGGGSPMPDNQFQTPPGMPSIPQAQTPAPTGNAGAVLTVTQLDEIQIAILTTPGVVIDFWNPGCGPCLQFKPVFSEIAEFYNSDKVKFYAINTKDSPQIGAAYEVTGVPTLHVYKNGELVDKFSGGDKPRLLGLIENLKKDLGDSVGKKSASQA